MEEVEKKVVKVEGDRVRLGVENQVGGGLSDSDYGQE